MSLQSDIITALAGVAGGQVYPQYAPDDVEPPFVIYRILGKTPLTTLDDTETLIQFVVAFEGYAESYQEALTLSAAVVSAIEVSGIDHYYKDSSPGDDYIPLIDGFMEPVFFGFWHN